MSERDRVQEALGFLEIAQTLTTTMSQLAAQQARAVDLFRQASTLAAEERRAAVPEGEIPVRAARSSQLIERQIRAELAVALNVSERTAESLLSRSYLLVEAPRILSAMDAGALSQSQARIVVDELVGVTDPEAREAIEVWVLEQGARLRPAELRRRLRAKVDALRAEPLQERHDAAVLERRVWIEDLPDGISHLGVVLPSVQAHAIFDRLTRITRAVRDVRGEDPTVPALDDSRTTDQVRADVLADLLIDGEVLTASDAVRGIRAEVCVTVPVTTLAGGEEPGLLDGRTPVDAETARELAAGCAEMTRILTHPETGVVLSIGRDRYRPPRRIRRAVRFRDGRCRFPGCTRPARLSELDHSIAYEHGGTTDLTNLAALCPGHHTVKHAGPWRVRHTDAADGTLEWTSPLGQTILDEPTNTFALTTPSF